MSDLPSPSPSHACGCLSGVTAKQASLLELAGGLEGLIWLVVQAKQAHEFGSEPGDAATAARLERAQLALTRMREWCRGTGWAK